MTPFTDADVDRLAATYTVPHHLARQILADLAAAGRLLPEPVETNTEWGLTFLSATSGIVMTGGPAGTREAAEELGREVVGQYSIAGFSIRSREHRRYADGSALVGAWRDDEESGR